MATKVRATIQDLYNVPDNAKAELVDGELLFMSPTGDLPGHAGDMIFVSLHEHARRTKSGRAIGDNKAFLVKLPKRQSLSPDAAYYTGPSSGMKFLPQAPVFAVEVRSDGDYGPQSEREMSLKRDDYFAAGTLVVWDVDLLGSDTVRRYTADKPADPVIFRRGQQADAEPAVPGWTMPVDDLFFE